MINSVILVGRLTKDTEIRTTQNSTTVASFSIAVSGQTKTDGNKDTYFFDCKAFNKLAEFLANYGRKGTQLAISGALTQSSWYNAEQKKQSKIEILVNDVQLFGSSKQTETKVEEPKQESKPKFTPEEAYQESIIDDDSLPF